MSEESTIDSPAPRRRSLRGRFSLRELLLAMTAICGLAAAFYTHRPFTPTTFLNSFRPQSVLEPIVKAAHPMNLSYGSSGGGGTSYDGHTATRQMSLTFHITSPSSQELLTALRAATAKALEAEGCNVYGRSTSSQGDFGFNYKKGNVTGFVSVHGCECSDRINIEYLAYEHR